MMYSALVYTKTRRCRCCGRSDRFLRTVKGESWGELRNTVSEQMATPEGIGWCEVIRDGVRVEIGPAVNMDGFPVEEPIRL